jgi:hypothetical protein
MGYKEVNRFNGAFKKRRKKKKHLRHEAELIRARASISTGIRYSPIKYLKSIVLMLWMTNLKTLVGH